MKRIITLWAALIATLTFAAPAWAQGQMELAWGTCKADGGPSDTTFPCGDGDGTPKASLHGSFSGGPHQPDLVAMDGTIEMGTAVPLPGFFRFATVVEPANCNPGIAFDYKRPATCTGAATLCDDGLCDYAFGVRTSSTDPLLSSNRATLVFSVYRTATVDVAANTDTFVFKIDFYADAATESGGSCSGCSGQAAFVFRRLGLLAPAGDGFQDYEIPYLDCATWNSGTSICVATPVKNRTWGALKSLYR